MRLSLECSLQFNGLPFLGSLGSLGHDLNQVAAMFTGQLQRFVLKKAVHHV